MKEIMETIIINMKIFMILVTFSLFLLMVFIEPKKEKNKEKAKEFPKIKAESLTFFKGNCDHISDVEKMEQFLEEKKLNNSSIINQEQYTSPAKEDL